METSGQRIVSQLCNRQFYDLLNSKKRFRVLQGGSRSGKTYAICQYIIYLLTSSKKPLVISIIRKTLPALKGSIQRDFLHILEQVNMYWSGIHNKAENTFRYKKHLVEFISVDQPIKIRGRKRDIAILNEANELWLEDFRQINMRSECVIMDYNPSDPMHWIYDEILPREDCDMWISTYKDNKFLSDDLVRELERLKDRDPDYWRVYGLGEKAYFSDRQIFNNWNFIDEMDFPEFDDPIIGIDFGFSVSKTAIVLLQKFNDKIYIKELCYKLGMTNQDIADFMYANKLNDILAYYDSAEVKSGEELKRCGLIVKPSIKGQGSVNAGISLLKEHDIFVSKSSKNIMMEYNSYMWDQTKDGTIINKAVPKNDHLCDAIRYCVFSHYKRQAKFFVL